MKKILSGKHIIKTYGKEGKTAKVLDGLDIDIFEGEFAAVMGASGCGKSTLLFALSGADDIDGGTVEFDGMELSQLKENELADIRRKKMGFVFQQPAMLKNLNILDNIILPALEGERKNINIHIRRAKELMEKVGITGLETRDITEVSGGQLQRAGICRALINKPKILFADEPTGALNSKSSEAVMELLSDINQSETATLMVTHDVKVAARADRVLFMKDGKMVSQLRFDSILRQSMPERISKLTSKMAGLEI